MFSVSYPESRTRTPHTGHPDAAYQPPTPPEIRPEGLVERNNFDLVEEIVPEPKDGEVLLRTLYISMDPTNRVWMGDIPQYLPPIASGEVMRSLGLGRVMQSRCSQYAEGDLVQGLTG